MSRELRSTFNPFPPQRAFLRSEAKIRGYGGAMGGGKSRTGCEAIFDACLDYPGIVAVIARQAHTSIIGTTRRTMLIGSKNDPVIPPDLIVRKKESGGEDFVELFNGSIIHFIGLDDPVRWFSSELGYLFMDEAQEIKEEHAVLLNSRLRQPGMPGKVIITFNPSSPGHWLQQWFLTGGQRTEFGFKKSELIATDASSSIGDAEFIFAKATDNPYLPDNYVEQNLGGFPERLRRRYLEGLWEFIEGNSFFDPDTLQHHEGVAQRTTPLLSGRVAGDPAADFKARRAGKKPDRKVQPHIVRGDGPLTVWKLPVRKTSDHDAHRYVMAIDVSSGGSYDWSAIQVISIEDFEQVAEYQGKLPPADLAQIVYLLGRVYNNALAVPEVTGGWGVTIQEELRRLNYPNPYTRKMLDRLTRKWTDRLGWDTTVKSRALMLDTLERVLREREFGLYSLRAVAELATFVYGKNDKPQAQEGCNDDLVVALAIAVTVAAEQPRQIRKVIEKKYVPQFAATGW